MDKDFEFKHIIGCVTCAHKVLPCERNINGACLWPYEFELVKRSPSYGDWPLAWEVYTQFQKGAQYIFWEPKHPLPEIDFGLDNLFDI